MQVLQRLILVSILTLPVSFYGQGFDVMGHWTFDQADCSKADKGDMVFNRFGGQQRAGGVKQGFLRLDRTRNNLIWADIKLDGAFTLEVWMRFLPEAFNPESRGISFSDKSMEFRLNMYQLEFNTTVLTSAGKAERDLFKISLDAQGRRSLGYYLDGDWHHFALQYDPQSGKKAVWVDGQSPEGFSKTTEARGRLCVEAKCFKRLYISYQGRSDWPLLADLDELILYKGYVPQGVLKQHYAVGRKGQGEYRWTASRNLEVVSEEAASFTAAIDPMEFPPGHPMVRTAPIDQLRHFPIPRYQPGHTLRPLYNWMEMVYFGGWFTDGVKREEAIANSTALMEEMGDHWHYAITLHNDNTIPRDPTVAGTFMHEWIKLANRRPDLPLAVTTFWAQTKVRVDGKRRIPRIYWKDHEPGFYLRNSSGQFLGSNGQATPKPLFISPAYRGELMEMDGKVHRDIFSGLVKYLDRPINFINENGEVPPLPIPEKLLSLDPSVTKDFQRSGLGNLDLYQARAKTRMRQTYSRQFLSLPILKNTVFSWYGVDGGPLDRYEWAEARKIQTPQNGYYYSTPDLYPRWPVNWAGWAGAWRGFAWLDSCRKIEILAGDKLFSPFVAPGWGAPERNVRPSQWLGMLKHIGVIGGEFMYTGYFNENAKPGNVSDPRNYAWQAVIPSYAQAITSRYEDILRGGNVLYDKKGRPIIRHKTNDPRVLLTVRKADDKPRYIIAASLNPITNNKGNAPDQTFTWVEIEGDTIEFEVRRQGSVYVYDKSRSLFYQLDRWHEPGHPWHWSEDFWYDAEVWDDMEGFVRATERPGSGGDFTEFTSYVRATKSGAKLGFRVSPRAHQTGSYDLLVRARSRDGSKAKFNVLLDNNTQGQWKCIEDKAWAWYNLSECGKGQSFRLEGNAVVDLHIESLSTELEIDQVLVRKRE